MRLTLERRRWLWGYTFIAIPLLFFLAIRIAPTLYAVWVSFHKWDPIAIDRPYIGMDNYRTLVDDKVFWKAMRNTWIYVGVGVPAGEAVADIGGADASAARGAQRDDDLGEVPLAEIPVAF